MVDAVDYHHFFYDYNVILQLYLWYFSCATASRHHVDKNYGTIESALLYLLSLSLSLL